MLDRYIAVRAATEMLAEPLSAEDQTIQSMPDASPAKWHRAHTTWFFETFLLSAHARDYGVFDARFGYLFNSYYEAVGPRHARPARGLLSRPSIDEIRRYREHVDRAMAALIETASGAAWAAILPLIELGLQHEQQHQELLMTDIKHAFWCNPIRPSYRPEPAPAATAAPALGWLDIPGGIYEIGHRDGGFAFDNELPVHRTLLRPFRIADRPVSVGEYLAFMQDGGYERPEFWLSDGWGHGPGRGLAGAVLLGARAGRWLADIHARRDARAGRGRAGQPCQLLRGRGLCELGRQAPAERRRGRDRAAAALPPAAAGSRRAQPSGPARRREQFRPGRLGVGGERLQPLSRLSRGIGRDRRI
ncbi:MAG: DinB family protein [Pseudomonadota bacterium]